MLLLLLFLLLFLLLVLTVLLVLLCLYIPFPMEAWKLIKRVPLMNKISFSKEFSTQQ